MNSNRFCLICLFLIWVITLVDSTFKDQKFDRIQRRLTGVEMRIMLNHNYWCFK